MKKVVVTIVGAAALTTIGMAAASNSTVAYDQQASSTVNPAGLFVSGNLGYGKVNYTTLPAVYKNNLSGFAWNANAGYQFNQYVALESGYTSFSDIKGNGLFGSLPTIDTYGVDLLAKLIYPINDQFNVFAKAGAMDIFTKAVYGSQSVQRSRVTPEFGIGTGYNLTSNIALTLQGITTLEMKGPNSASFTMPATYAGYAGLSYKFNV